MASLYVATSDIQDTLQRLLQQWDHVQDVWNDPVSREFQEQYVEPLDVQTRAAQREMEKVAQIIEAATKSVK